MSSYKNKRKPPEKLYPIDIIDILLNTDTDLYSECWTKIKVAAEEKKVLQ